MLARLLPPVVLVLLAASKSGHCLVPCPEYCTSSFAVLRPGGGQIKWIQGPDATSVLKIIKSITMPGQSTTVVTIRINGVDVSVPSFAKPMIIEILKRHPDLSKIIIELLQRRTPGFPSQDVPAGRIPQPFTTPPGIDVRPGPNFPMELEPGNPMPQPVPDDSFYVRRTPGIILPTAVAPIETPMGVYPEPSSRFTPPDIMSPFPVMPDNTPFVAPDILSYLELLARNPDYFVPIYNILINKGVRFPDVNKPITYVIVNGRRINLPREVRVLFTVRINGQPFVLPRDAPRLVSFISQHPNQLTTIVTILRQFGAVVKRNPDGRVTAFILFGKTYPLPSPVTTQIIVNGRRFTLPQDLPSLIATVQSNPQAFHKILPILISFGARPQKSPTGEITTVIINGRSFPVRSVAPLRVTISGRTYTIPADLDLILKQPGSLVVGELISALQKLHIPVNVDKDTGNVIGIVMDGVPIPFPVIVRLRVNVGGKVYRIPNDLPALVTYLEQHGMPARVLSFLYNYYGIIPVRDSNNVVIAISFNDRRYPVRRQPETTVNIGGNQFVLPRDTRKLLSILVNHKVPIEEFLLVIQKAGYRLIPGPDGTLHSVQKGFDVVNLPVNVRLVVTINGARYRVPNDLPRIIQVFRRLGNPGLIEQVLTSLRKIGVIVQRDGGQTILIFNGQRFSFPYTPRTGGDMVGPSTGTVTIRVNFNGRSFTLPDQLGEMMTVVRSSGPTATQLLIKILSSQGITVNMSPDGTDIIAIIIQGQVYPVPGSGGTPGWRGGSAGGQNIQVIIRGRTFMIPRDIGILRRSLPGFQYGELIVALHRAGAMLEVDQRGNFYGMRVRGRLIKFAVIFRVNVMLDKSGRQYRVPLDLAELAQGLSSGQRWNWRVVRKVLYNSGIEVRGGTVGAPRAIGFQGKFFELRHVVRG
ncbi:uncharacterized protein LOC144128397 [Amblyomma americanum]